MIQDAAAFGKMVRLRRREARMTQRDLAAAVDTGERFIVELEAGKPSCQLGKALAVARALGIDLVDASAPNRARQPVGAESELDGDLPELGDLDFHATGPRQ